MDNLDTQGCPGDFYLTMGKEKEEEPAPEELPPTKASGAVERGVRIKRLAVKTKSDYPLSSTSSSTKEPSDNETLETCRKRVGQKRERPTASTTSPPVVVSTAQPPRISLRKKAKIFAR